MFIEIFPSGPFETNAIVIGCERTREAAIIDPAPESAESIKEFLVEKGLKPTAIFLTHTHMDHIGDVAALKKHFSIPVWVHPLDAENMRTPGSDGLPLLFPIQGVEPDFFFEENGEISIGELEARVIHTPGHTPGGVCLYFPKEKVLISGDTLFHGSIGNLSFPTASPEAMWASLKKLEVLPPDTRFYPGHGLSSTIGEETWLPKAKEMFS